MPGVKFPNLFIIGAMKAGTSSLHEYLHQHPNIFMSRFKEPQYFSGTSMLRTMAAGKPGATPPSEFDCYLKLFQDAGSVSYAGESSTNYAKEPVVSGCAERIWEFNPHAHIIYIMRDPVARTLSHYWYYVAGRFETRTLARTIAEDVQYTAYSDYVRQLEPYWRRFGMESVYPLTFEDLLQTPEAIMRQLFCWLAVDGDFALWRTAAFERDTQASPPITAESAMDEPDWCESALSADFNSASRCDKNVRCQHCNSR